MIHSVSDLIAIVRKVAKSEDFRAIVRFAEGAGKVIAVGTVVLTAWLWIRSIPERTRTAHYAAWQVIAQAQSQTGSAGRVDALQSLAADHVNLDGVDVHGAFLYDLHLNGAALRGANFSGTHLREPVFDNADISDADFRQVTVIRAVLHRTVETSFHNAKISGTRFDGSKLITADLSTEHHRHFQYEAGDDGEKDYHTSFAGANAYRANFTGREMDWAEFAGASLPDSDFTNTAFWDSDFRGAALSGSRFERALLLYADFTGSCLNGVSFEGATLVGVNFSDAMFDRGTNFRGALIDRAERNKILVSLAHAQNAALAIYDPAVKTDLDHVLASRPLPAIAPYDEHSTKITTQAVRTIVQPSGVRDSITPGLGILDARATPDLFPAHVPSPVVCLGDSWGPNGRSSLP